VSIDFDEARQSTPTAARPHWVEPLPKPPLWCLDQFAAHVSVGKLVALSSELGIATVDHAAVAGLLTWRR
jgi:hypothetical protein